MALKTVEKGPLEGRVCYATLEGKKRFATVEVAMEQCAYRFRERLDKPLREGEWIRFSGKARVQVVSRKDEPERLERIGYYHPPYDGSDVREWTYFDLGDARCERIGPLDVLDALSRVGSRIKLHSDDWFSNCTRAELEDTVRALDRASVMMAVEMGREEAERDDTPVVAPDIEV